MSGTRVRAKASLHFASSREECVCVWDDQQLGEARRAPPFFQKPNVSGQKIIIYNCLSYIQYSFFRLL